MMKWTPWVIGLAAIWLVASGVSMLARRAAPTPEAVIEFVSANPLPASDPRARERLVREAATRLDRLDFEQRRDLRGSAEFREFVDSMDESERSLFLDLTLPEGFRQMMVALNKMSPEERRRIVERALRDLDEETDGDGQIRERPEADDEQTQKIIREGMSAFYEEANSDVKLDFAPVIEQIQRALQSRR